MKLLLLDYVGRNWWILALGAAVEAGLGWVVAQGPAGEFPGLRLVTIVQFQLALFTGAILLSLDLQRGLARVVAAMPVTARQIGRAWWLSCVGLPAAALAASLFSGAELFQVFHPDNIFPGGALARISLDTMFALGGFFALVFTRTVFSGLRGSSGRKWLHAARIGFRVLAGLLIGGGVFFVYLNGTSWMMSGVFAGAGAVLTVASWFGAEHFVRGRAGFRLAALQSGGVRGLHRAPEGYGGMPLFISAIFLRCFLVGLAMEILTALFTVMPPGALSWRFALTASAGACNMVWMLMAFQWIPGVLHLRLLRTLPVSASRLTVVLIVAAFLPVTVLGALAAGVTGAALGTAAALGVLKHFALTLAPCAFCLWVAVRQGIGRQASAALMIAVVVFQTLPVWTQMIFHRGEAPSSVAGAVATGSVLLAFLLTRRALMRSSCAYRVQTGAFANTIAGADR